MGLNKMSVTQTVLMRSKRMKQCLLSAVMYEHIFLLQLWRIVQIYLFDLVVDHNTRIYAMCFSIVVSHR